MMDQPTCLLCGSNEDYLCLDHQELISNYNTQRNTTMMAVIGNELPRTVDIYPDELPMISTHSTIEDFHKMLNNWEAEQIDVASYSFLVRFAEGVIDSLTDEDLTCLILTNYQIAPLVLVFENDDSLKTFIAKFEKLTLTSINPPVMLVHHRLDSVLDYLTDVELPNIFLIGYISRKVSSD